MGHQYTYHSAPAPPQRQVAANPWDDPPPAQEQAAASRGPSSTSHSYMYNSAPAPPRQRAAPNPWDDPLPVQEQAAANYGPSSTGHQYTYRPAPAPPQRQVAANPWDDPPPAHEQAATNRGPISTGHHYVYHPAPRPTQRREAPNPWDDPQPAQEQVAANPWDDPAPVQRQVATISPNAPPQASAPFNPWTNTQQPRISHVAYPVFCAVYPLHLAPAPAAMHYPGHTGIQYYASAPAPEPYNRQVYEGRSAEGGGHNHVSAHYGGPGGQPGPIQIVPRNPSVKDEYYCRELNSSYSLRTATAIMRDCQPGYWDHGSSGYPYWIRTT